MSCATPSALIPVRLINPGLTAGAIVCRLFEAPFLRASAVSLLVAALPRRVLRGCFDASFDSEKLRNGRKNGTNQGLNVN
jgi:hypothetical protein